MPNGQQESVWTCGSCGDTFDSAGELYGHRATAHADEAEDDE